MNARERLTEQQVQEILRRYRSSEPIRQIAAAFGVGPHYPAKLARRHGHPLRRPEVSAALKTARADGGWKPEADRSAPRCAPGSDIRTRLLAGEPMLIVAADLDIGLGELVAAASACR